MPWTKRGSGCDKEFYWDGQDKDGWLNFKDATVMKAELAARGKLLNMEQVIPTVDQTRTAPALAGGAKALGYYVQRVNLGMTIKPQMNVFEVLRPIKAEIGSVDNSAALKASLQYILDHCDIICNEVGELTLGIDKDSGKAYLLDLAKTNGQAGGPDQAVKAKSGLEKMIALL